MELSAIIRGLLLAQELHMVESQRDLLLEKDQDLPQEPMAPQDPLPAQIPGGKQVLFQEAKQA